MPQARDVELVYNDDLVDHVNQVERGSQTRAQLLAGLQARTSQRIGPVLLMIWREDQRRSQIHARDWINDGTGSYRIGAVLFAILLTLVGPVGFLSNWRHPGFIVEDIEGDSGIPFIFFALICIAGFVIHCNLEREAPRRLGYTVGVYIFMRSGTFLGYR